MYNNTLLFKVQEKTAIWKTFPMLNAFAFSLSLSGIESDVILQLCEDLAPLPLDKSDLYQINKAVKDGEKRRADEEL